MPMPKPSRSSAAPRARSVPAAKPVPPRKPRKKPGSASGGASARPATGAAPRRRRLAPEARRAELMAVAIEVFARRGLGEARHAEIAAEAGVSVPTVFVYFPTRDALVHAVLDHVASFLMEMGAAIHAGKGPADAILLEHLRTFAESVRSAPATARVWLDWSTAVREKVWPRYMELLNAILAMVRTTLERGQREGSISAGTDPEDQARLLVGSAHMLALMQFSGAPPEKLEHFFTTLMDAVVGPRPAAKPRAAEARRKAGGRKR